MALRNPDVELPLRPARQSQDGQPPSIFDRIWTFAEWYEDDSNPVVQRVLFSGRYQHDFSVVRADQGDLEEWNVRRMRLGPKITLFRDFTVHAEVELNPQEHDPLYLRLTDAYVQWARGDALAVTVGKHGVPFTVDGSTSSKELLAIDRSNLSNNLWFTEEYIPGVSISGDASGWMYRAGLYTAGRATREFGRFSGGLFTLGTLGYDFGNTLGVDEALVAGSYVYQDSDTDNTFTRPLEHVGSIGLQLATRRWGLRSDVAAAAGYLDGTDLWGAMAMPYVNLTDALQFVVRYTVVESDGPNGVRLATYENRIVTGRGDLYRELYLGGNYYFYGHKLKLQTGLQLADLDDEPADGGAYSGVSWTSGIRISW